MAVNVVADIRTEDGKKLLDPNEILQQLGAFSLDFGQNTTIGVVVTNVTLNQAQVALVARMAQSVLARIIPVHIPLDGDTFFSVTTEELDTGDVLEIGLIAAEVISQAIIRAATSSEGIPSYSEISEFEKK